MGSSTVHATAGDLDCSFGIGGSVTRDFGGNEAALSMGRTSDGRLVTMGSESSAIRLTRFLADGQLDTTFGNNGTVLHALPGFSYAYSVALDSQDRIVVVGDLVTNSQHDAFVARFTASGQLDASFNGSGWNTVSFTVASGVAGNGADERATAVAIDASDRPILAGYVDPNANIVRPSNRNSAVARFNVDGQLDTGFGAGNSDVAGITIVSTPGTENDDHVQAMTLDPSGRILLVGITTWPTPSNDLPRRTLVARLTANGALDNSFGSGGIAALDLSLTGTDNFGRDIVADGPNSIVVLGQTMDDPTISRLTDTGALDPSFNGTGSLRTSFFGGQDTVARLFLQADRKLLVTGWPVAPNLTFHFASMRLNPNGQLDTSWGGTGVVSTHVGYHDYGYTGLLQPDQRLVMAGQNRSNDDLLLVRYLTDGDSGLTPTTAIITSDTPDPSPRDTAVTVGVNVTANTGPVAPAGSVRISSGTASCNAPLAGGGTTASGSCSLTLTAGGTQTITAFYSGSMCNSSASTSHQVLASSTSTTLTSSPNPSVTGQGIVASYSVTPTGSGTPTGNVTVSDGIDSCTGTVAAGSCSLTLHTAGNRTLTANYAGDGSHGASSTSASQQVTKALATAGLTLDQIAVVAGGSVKANLTMQVQAPGAGTPTGTVTVQDGAGGMCVASLSAGSGSCNFSVGSPGGRLVLAHYSGDANFAPFDSPIGMPLAVDAIATATSVTSHTPTSSVVGQSVTVGFGVNPASPFGTSVSGTVTVSDGVDSCSAGVAAGSCTLALHTLGDRTLTVSYSGDGNYVASSTTISHSVTQARALLALGTANPNQLTGGGSVQVSFTVAPELVESGTPTGLVTVSDGLGGSCQASVAAGQCALTLSGFGTHTLGASYPGDTFFLPASASNSLQVQVDPGSAGLAVTGRSPAQSVVGQPVAVSYSVSPNPAGSPSGNVTVGDGVDSCTGSVAAGGCMLTLRTAGSRTLAASYAGDATYGSGQASVSHSVSAATTTLTLAGASPASVALGGSTVVSFQLAVQAPGAGTPTGMVTISDGQGASCQASPAAGQCALTVGTTAGTRSLTASYPGDGNFSASSSAPLSLRVSAGSTSVAITTHVPALSLVGQPVAVSYQVSPTPIGSVSGTVTVTDGTDSCSGTVAAGGCALTPRSAGSRTLTASYAGDANYGGSSATALHQVNAAPTLLTITGLQPSTVPPRGSTRVSFALSVPAPASGTPTGTVTLDDGAGASCQAAAAAGGCTLQVSDVPGVRTLTANYSGDSNYLPTSSAGVTLQVQAPAIPLLAPWALVTLAGMLAAAGRRAARRTLVRGDAGSGRAWLQ